MAGKSSLKNPGTVLFLILPVAYACPEGQFLPKNGTCRPCDTKCIGGQVIVASCSKHENLRCECPGKEYFIELKHQCFPCKITGDGEYYRRNCSKYENADVSKCPLGMFTLDHYQCHNCSKCSAGHKVVFKCDGSRNTECKEISEPGSLSKGEIAGAVLGPLLLLVSIVIAILLCRRKHAHRSSVEGNAKVNGLSSVAIDNKGMHLLFCIVSLSL
ncbi:tumor necrosis factor receptor superfamily member 16-like [Rhopilema esculentum]|uniref:tumor necrosis factor receptor superfamily member 16-like n=1 Tax=Rhopilema esculentum TaxID=499914 RepID=UPI0031CE6911